MFTKCLMKAESLLSAISNKLCIVSLWDAGPVMLLGDICDAGPH